MKGKNSKYDSGCPEALNSKCVKWNGPAIPCLDICHEDVLTDVVYSIATRVCELTEELDLSTLDLHCIIDLCDSCPTDKSLKSILQLMLENQCALKELIDDIITAINSGGSGGAVVLTLDMKCLEIFDPFGNPVDQDINQTLQSIINEVCLHRDQIAALQAKDIDLQTQINNIGTGGGGSTYVPPTVTVPVDCINSPTPTLPADLAVQPLLNAFCDLKTVLGPNADLSTSIGRQCANLNTIYGLVPNWIQAPATIADTINNQWIVICDILNRVKTIETTCCAPTCSDIKIGFTSKYIVEDNTFEITFDSANGTEIPVGFTDCGSVMTITDHLNHSKVIGITIVQGDTIVIDASGLDLSEVLSVSIKTCFEHVTGLKCNDCFSGVMAGDPNAACPFCPLVVTGTSGTVTIVYTTPGNSSYQTVVIPANGSGYIQKDATVISITSTGNASLEDQECIDMNIPDPLCYAFGWTTRVVFADALDLPPHQMMNALIIGSLRIPFVDTIGTPKEYAMFLDSNNPTASDLASSINVVAAINNNHHPLVTAQCPTEVAAEDPNGPFISTTRTEYMKITIPAALGTVRPELEIQVSDYDAGTDITYTYVKGDLTPNCECT